MITRNRYDYSEDITYQGLSTYSKPTEGVAINSFFLELDTGDIYYYDGSAWAEFGD